MKYTKGQTLVEISIVFGISAIVIVSLVLLASSALRQAQESVRRTSSTKLANAGVEAVIYYKNLYGFNTSLFPATVDASTCLQITGSGLVSAPNCNGATVINYDNLIYSRVIRITKTSDTEYRVDVSVGWNTGGANITDVVISRILTKWN